MTIPKTIGRLKRSLIDSAGTIVFGMEDGTVSIFGLVFGVAATTSSTAAVLVAGASGAAAAAVSMMAGVYLDAETSRDAAKANRARLQVDRQQADEASVSALLASRLGQSRLTADKSAALAAAVRADPNALKTLMAALQAAPPPAQSPLEQAIWMLLADFVAASVPLLPFIFLPVSQARIASAVVTMALLVALGIGRGRIAGTNIARTAIETVLIGIAAALAGVAIGMMVGRLAGA